MDNYDNEIECIDDVKCNLKYKENDFLSKAIDPNLEVKKWTKENPLENLNVNRESKWILKAKNKWEI